MEGKVLIFIVAAVVVPTAVFSKDTCGEKSPRKWKRVRRMLWGDRVSPFFAGNKRPTGLSRIATSGREIQQKLPSDPAKKPPYFVSCFDLDENTAFYSAYKVTPEQAKDLGKFSLNDVKVYGWRNTDVRGLDDAYSAAITDTSGSPLSRGHMNPVTLNTFDKSFMNATFTLSNAVPQFETSKNGPWRAFETRIRNYAKNTCGPRGGTLYLLTGKSGYGLRFQAGSPVQDVTTALPYPKENFPKNVKLVTPRAVWTAGCCIWAEPDKFLGKLWAAKKAESFAVMSNNMDDSALLHQTEMSVSQLEKLLRPPLLKEVNLFPGNEKCRRAENDITLETFRFDYEYQIEYDFRISNQ